MYLKVLGVFNFQESKGILIPKSLRTSSLNVAFLETSNSLESSFAIRTFNKYLYSILGDTVFSLTLNVIEISCLSHSMLQMSQFTHSFCFFVCNSFVFLKLFFIYILLNNDVRVARIIIITVMTPHEELTIHKLGQTRAQYVYTLSTNFSGGLKSTAF